MKRYKLTNKLKLVVALTHLTFYAISIYITINLIIGTGRPQTGIYGGEWLAVFLAYPLILLIAKALTAISSAISTDHHTTPYEPYGLD